MQKGTAAWRGCRLLVTLVGYAAFPIVLSCTGVLQGPGPRAGGAPRRGIVYPLPRLELRVALPGWRGAGGLGVWAAQIAARTLGRRGTSSSCPDHRCVWRESAAEDLGDISRPHERGLTAQTPTCECWMRPLYLFLSSFELKITPSSSQAVQVFSATLTRTDFEPEEWRSVLQAPEPAFALVPVCSLLPAQCLPGYEAAGGDVF